MVVDGLDIGVTDRLAVAGSTAVLVTSRNDVTRIDLTTGLRGIEPKPTVPSDAPALTITASGDLIWLDNEDGEEAWVAYRFGINPIDKDEEGAPILDAQGQLQDNGSGEGNSTTGGSSTADVDETSRLDDNGVQDPPVAVDDSVTARAGNTITIPVTGNDYDPDGDPIVVVEGDTRAGHPRHDRRDRRHFDRLPSRARVQRYRLVRVHDHRRPRRRGYGDSERRAVPAGQPQPATYRTARQGQDPNRSSRHH